MPYYKEVVISIIISIISGIVANYLCKSKKTAIHTVMLLVFCLCFVFGFITLNTQPLEVINTENNASKTVESNKDNSNDNSFMFFVDATVYSYNGSMIVMDVAPYIKDNYFYVPLEYLAYAIGIVKRDIKWNKITKTITLIKGKKEIQLVIGDTTVHINGKAKLMDVAPEINNERIMLPAKFVAEAYDCTVGWNPATQTLIIHTES